MTEMNMERLVDTVIDRVMERFIEVEASGRHIHLNREAVNQLFGEDYKLTKMKDLSQPGQFVCRERVTIIGPKGKLENVVILGPERKHSQVEISLTDAVSIGINVPVRESGKIENTPAITIRAERNEVKVPQGLIVAKRHIHMSPEDAVRFDVKDQETVQVHVYGKRPLIFDDVLVRVSDRYRTVLHIDYDEANACGFYKGTLGRIIKKEPKG